VKLQFPQPFESEDFADPFAESDSQTLSAGLELGAFEILDGWLGWGFAE